MVDWSLARQIARLAAGSADAPADLGIDLAATCQELEGPVAGYTRLVPASPVPRAEPVGREEWVEANLTTLSSMLDPVAERLEQRLEFAGPLAGALRVASRATLAAEAGLVMGYVSQRVLGQYEVSLLSGEAPARLLFVAPNLDKAVRQLEVEREPFLRWVCAHELTHVFQFQGVPWLRGHLGSLMRRYLESVEVRIERGNAGGLPALPDPGRLVELFREGGLIALVQSREQRDLMSEVQAAMAVVEGYSEHVMDALGEDLIPDQEKLRAAMQRRRNNRSAPERVIERLLGLDFKMRQYALGKSFCDAVAAEGGMERLNGVWSSPEALPTIAELEEPARWLERTKKPAALSPGR
ncbi:MAG TPA: zinc-dependent metalloprotease [Thermoleophilaceae bacterium]|nr:zinc-dependent metalloprotease [Thermoleophilaceae bacterium]